MSISRSHNFLFVSAPFSGIEVFMKNVRHINDAVFHIESSWIWLAHTLDFSGFKRAIFHFVNWTVKASYFTHLRIRELEHAGNVYDAAFFNHVTPLTFLLRFRKRIPSVLSLDSTPILMDQFSALYRNTPAPKPTSRISRYKFRWTRNAYRDASFILAWSEWVKRSLVDDYHIPEKNIAVVPPGVDTERFTLANRSDRNPARNVKILFVGGEFRRKGGDILLELAHEERFRHHEFHFVTRTFAGEQGPNIFVYENISPNSDLLQVLYADADIFVLPTRGDFCPTNTICEAMATGLPVITTNVGGLDEIVKDHETGMIVGVDDKTHLADVIEELSADREMRFRLGSNARACVEQKYDLQKNSGTIFSYLTLAADNAKDSTLTKGLSGKTPVHE